MRRWCWGGAALALLLLLFSQGFHSNRAADTPTVITVRFDSALVAKKTGVSESPPAIASLAPWEEWLGSRTLTISPPEIPTDVKTPLSGWTDRKSRGGLEFVNNDTQPLRLRLLLRLPEGLWRVEAALVTGVTNGDGTFVALLPATPPPALWRLESILNKDEAETTKTIDVPPGAALFLRWTETGDAALVARNAVRAALWSTADHPLQDRVSAALAPVNDTLDALPILVERGDRAKITRRIHTALLATAKAQALWENGRALALDEPDEPFATLVTALSEIACAAFDLVPAQTLLPASGDAPARMTVALTNAGPRTVPLVALGIEPRHGTTARSDLSVFRALAPGATVTKTFPLPKSADDSGTDARGIVQFISDNGAATVKAAPEGPTPEGPTPEGPTPDATEK